MLGEEKLILFIYIHGEVAVFSGVYLISLDALLLPVLICLQNEACQNNAYKINCHKHALVTLKPNEKCLLLFKSMLLLVVVLDRLLQHKIKFQSGSNSFASVRVKTSVSNGGEGSIIPSVVSSSFSLL